MCGVLEIVRSPGSYRCSTRTIFNESQSIGNMRYTKGSVVAIAKPVSPVTLFSSFIGLLNHYLAIQYYFRI